MLGQGPAWSERPLPGGGALPFGAYLGRSEGSGVYTHTPHTVEGL